MTDTAVRASDSAIDGTLFGHTYATGDFEDAMAEVGVRVLVASVCENEFAILPWPELAPVVVEIPPEEMGGMVGVRWAGQPRWRWFLLNPIPPPLPAWRQSLDGTESCAVCKRTNEDDVLRPANSGRLVCPECSKARRGAGDDRG